MGNPCPPIGPDCETNPQPPVCGDWTDQSCVARSYHGNLIHHCCDQASTGPCIYYSVTVAGEPRWECDIADGTMDGWESNSYNTACNGWGLTVFNPLVDEGGGGYDAGLRVGYADDGPGSGAWGATGFDDAVFLVPGSRVFRFLVKPVGLLVDPCLRERRYCPENTVGDSWLGRATWCDYDGWRVWCNKTLALWDDGYYGWCRDQCRQLPPRELPWPGSIHIGTLAFLTFNLRRGHCFPFANHYCFSMQCGGASSPKWNCIGEDTSAPDTMKNAVATLNTTFNLRCSTDNQAFPHPNVHQIPLGNNAWAHWGRHVEALENSHSPASGDYKRGGQFLWQKTEKWDELHPDVQSGAIGEPYPAMTYQEDIETPGSPLYPGGIVGQVVPITAHAWLSGRDYPCVMRLYRYNLRMHLYVERMIAPGPEGEWRVYGDITVEVTYRVALTPAAYTVAGPFKLLRRPDNGEDPPPALPIEPGDLEAQFDLRMEDPANPGQPHPVERLTAHGPNFERVPAHQGLSHLTRPTLRWRGLRAPPPWGIGGEFTRPCLTYLDGTAGSCCGAFQAIEASVLHGANNNIIEGSGSVPQRYEGWVRLSVPDLNDGQAGTLRDVCGCAEFGYDHGPWEEV